MPFPIPILWHITKKNFKLWSYHKGVNFFKLIQLITIIVRVTKFTNYLRDSKEARVMEVMKKISETCRETMKTNKVCFTKFKTLLFMFSVNYCNQLCSTLVAYCIL